ncbi:MAG: hypothetical protein AABX25_04745 [Nanoarchaeota archaeon]
MQLFKPKQKSIDILPPPPPFPTMDFEEEPKEMAEPVKFDKIKQDFSQNVTEFRDLLKDLDKSRLKDKNISARQKKLSKKELKKLRKLKLEQRKETKSLKKSEEKHIGNIDDVEKLWLQDFDDFQDLGIENLGLEFGDDLKKPKKGKSSKKENEIEFPDTLNELDLDYAKPATETKTRQKPKELEDAEKEIQSAIESIKKHEKQSFFSRLFSTNFKSKDYGMQNVKIETKQGFVDEWDDISQINKKIEEAREALINFNLEAAKRKYIEAMQIYNQIKPEEKAKVYNDIKELYYKRKNAEELKV